MLMLSVGVREEENFEYQYRSYIQFIHPCTTDTYYSFPQFLVTKNDTIMNISV